jgi:asparagine synthase (glutamine-hydrolysing)
MCGIAGFIDTGIGYEELEKMTNVMHRRGPDAAGFYYENQVGFGHRRLAILELSALGDQPYYFESLVLVFNGELYNYQEVKKELLQQGYIFNSNSDTEVLIKAFHYWREEAVHRFIGMFAFAVYDKRTEELFLFRDRVGVKPLFYAHTQGLIFGSELKVFKTLPRTYSLDKEAIYQYFKFGYVTNDNTIYREIKKVLPGHYLRYHKNKIEQIEYWTPSLEKHKEGISETVVLEELEGLLQSAFKYRMVSDVPVGVFLSGGIDSSLVTAVLQKKYGNINTFTIGFDNLNFNEAPYAAKVAAALGSRHHEYTLGAERAKKLLYDFYDIYDEPFSDSSGIPTTLVSELAYKENIKVVLSADGGDELFCGYTHYERIRKSLQRYLPYGKITSKAQASLIRQLDKLGLLKKIYAYNFEHKALAYENRLLSSDFTEFYQNSISNQADAEIEKLIGYTSDFKSIRKKKREGTCQVEEMMYWDFLHYLPDDLLVKVDRATMYHSIEGREPFLDHRLVEYSYTLPLKFKCRDGVNKYVLKKLLSRYVPSELFERPKQGFSIPIFQWFTKELNGLIRQYLTEEKLKETGAFNVPEVMKELDKFDYYVQRNQQYNIQKVYRLLSFMMWWDKWNRR